MPVEQLPNQAPAPMPNGPPVPKSCILLQPAVAKITRLANVNDVHIVDPVVSERIIGD
jgi:hypothetical protein